MHAACECGAEARSHLHSFGCLECGSAVCPSCAIHLESAAYCRTCAATLLDTPAVGAGAPFTIA
ncbi:MAG TPA: hypothetical protein VNN07_19515 [Candidatus Tectomicrobia bacterium]|nr:hypothetical protein [Candidatus Tectomicrobia bacterium]